MYSRLSSHPFGSPNLIFCSLLALLGSVGCGQLKSYTATEQLLLSNAVDEAVQKLDFSPLAGKKVFVDTSFVRDGKQYGCVHDGYMISSVRQQMMADGCLLFDKREDADVIIEARVGTLGADAHEITYGLPASNALSSAATVMGTGAPIPAIPEISLAKRTQNDGAAKVALFAYDAKTREPLWQSGVSLAKTTSANTWLLGAGPWPKNKNAKKSKRWRIFGGEEESEKIVSDDEEDAKANHKKVAFDHSHVFPALKRAHFDQPPQMLAEATAKGASTRVSDAPIASAPPPVDSVTSAVKQVSGETPVANEKKPETHTQGALASSAALGQ